MSLSSLGIVVALFSVTILLIVYLIDINRYQSKIVGILKKNTGRTFHFQDRIYFTIYPWLGINLGKVKVSNASGFEALDFADIEKVKVRIKLIPLLTKRFEIDTIRLEGMTVNFMRKSDGTNNWDDLLKSTQKEPKQQPKKQPIQSKQPEQPKQQEQPKQSEQAKQQVQQEPQTQKKSPVKQQSNQLPIDLEKLKIQGLDINHLNLTFEDQQTQSHYVFSDLNLKASPISLNQSIQIQLNTAFNMTNVNALDGQVKLETKITLQVEKTKHLN